MSKDLKMSANSSIIVNTFELNINELLALLSPIIEKLPSIG
jgi:hypothetical protein